LISGIVSKKSQSFSTSEKTLEKLEQNNASQSIVDFRKPKTSKKEIIIEKGIFVYISNNRNAT
jgi:glucan-binding YG repeat protein